MKSYQEVKIDGCRLRISNPDKVLYPDVPMTKWDYILFCASLAPYLLPYTRDRLLTTIRYPDGIHRQFFYQKNVPKPCPEWVDRRRVGSTDYILLNNRPTLIWLANLACLEFHTSFHYYWSDCPTELIFDLDPSTPDFQKVIEVALETKKILDQMNLVSYVKTSGASGLQIYIPIKRGYTFEETRRVSHFVAKYLQEKRSDLVTLKRKVGERGEKVYIDYLQHWRGKTLIAPYSPRATAYATVSAPLQWRELENLTTPNQFHLKNIQQRLKEKGDPFSPILKGPQMDLGDILQFLRKHDD